MAARDLRRAFLRRVCREAGYDKVALGHTADDQVELFFLRLLRGAGLTGLAGMWPASPEGFIRPLLGVGKAPLLAWLTREGLPYRQDLSNLSPAYLRNRVRQELLPQLEARYNPRLREGIWRLMARLREDEGFLGAETEAAFARLVRRPAPDLLALDTAALLGLPGAVQSRLLQRLVAALGGGELLASQRRSLLSLAQARKSGGLLSLPGCTVARAGGELHFFPPLPPAPSWQGLLPGPGGVETPPGWRWEVRVLPSADRLTTLPPEMVHLDAGQGVFPLEVRPPRPGDRCRPAGAPGVRKLQDVLTDLQVPRWLRPHLPLVLCQGRVVWLAGLGAAHPGRPSGGAVVEISLCPTTPFTRRLWGYILGFARPKPRGTD
jgi:tRNA(Ile)-lysidine synthase